MKKRVARVMLLGAVLPGGVHAADAKATSHPTQLTSNLSQGKVQKKAAPILTAQSHAVAKGELALNQAVQEKQDGVAANPPEFVDPPFRLRGVRG